MATACLKPVVPTDGERAPLGSVRDGTVVYAIGDIHGRADLLCELHEAIRADMEKRHSTRQVIVYLGDYTCRGNESSRVIQILCGHSMPGFEQVFLRGNHEDIICKFLGGDLSWGAHWLKYGGVEALATYGITAEAYEQNDIRELAKVRHAFTSNLPASHLRFFQETKFSHREGDYIFVHAGIKPGLALESNDPNTLLWIRREFLCSKKDHGGIVIHGHTISDEPEVRHNRIGIDTGAYGSGILTCLVLESNQQWFLQTDPEFSWGRRR